MLRHPMSFNDDIAAIRVRLASARSAREAWRACGRLQKYVEGHFLVASLEAELERLRQRGLRALAQ